MGVPTVNTDPMTVEEFYAFTNTRPDEEKWELIDGEPIMQASASRAHQRIIVNLILELGTQERERAVSLSVLPDFGFRISDTNRPQPDILIIPKLAPPLNPSQRDCDDVIVAFEVLSPSTADRDLRWKRAAYASMPSLTHYVVIAQDAVEVVVFARENGFAEQRFRSLDDVVAFPGLGASLPLAEIYRDTGLK